MAKYLMKYKGTYRLKAAIDQSTNDYPRDDSGGMFDNCGKHIGRSQECSDQLRKWAESEYVETPVITSKEKKFLDLLLPNYKYIARDKNGFLLAYTEKPIKILETWGIANCALINMFDIKFDFIKREDEEPWSIEDLKKLEVKDK